MKATAQANANIAFIKYWGNENDDLRIPSNPSISMNLDGLYTETTVEWFDDLQADELKLNGATAGKQVLDRVSRHLEEIRKRYAVKGYARVHSHNNFPMGAGIASSAAAFAALSKAATTAAGLDLTEKELTSLARLGSGSASRSIPNAFVVWHQGDSHETSFAESIANRKHWDLVDVIAIVHDQHKKTGSSKGHLSATTSILQPARVADAQRRFDICKTALLQRDFKEFAKIVEEDSDLMHAIMMTSRPPLFYWKPSTLAIMDAVREWRKEAAIDVCYTLDAGPNVHCICARDHADTVRTRLSGMSGVLDVRVAGVGGGAQIVQH